MPNAERIREVVTGFATPAMVGHDDQGRVLNAFSDPADVHRIEAGYGCGNCCAIFVSFQLDCPVCGMATHVANQRQQTPQEWLDHVKARAGTERTEVPTFEEAMQVVRADDDVDHVALSRLRPPKFGRGR